MCTVTVFSSSAAVTTYAMLPIRKQYTYFLHNSVKVWTLFEAFTRVYLVKYFARQTAMFFLFWCSSHTFLSEWNIYVRWLHQGHARVCVGEGGRGRGSGEGDGAMNSPMSSPIALKPMEIKWNANESAQSGGVCSNCHRLSISSFKVLCFPADPTTCLAAACACIMYTYARYCFSFHLIVFCWILTEACKSGRAARAVCFRMSI